MSDDPFFAVKNERLLLMLTLSADIIWEAASAANHKSPSSPAAAVGENKVSSSNGESGKWLGPSNAADVFKLVVTFSGDANLGSTLS